MKLVRTSLVSALVVSMLGCSTTSDVDVDNNQKLYTQAEIDLMLAKAKADERTRIEKELHRQEEQKNLFSQILARQNQTKDLKTNQQVNQKTKDADKVVNTKTIDKIIPKSRKQVLYREQNGVKYFRCAANSLVAVSNKNNHWVYDASKQELSATLCKISRDKNTMVKLQQKLYDLGLLKSNTLTKQQLIDGVWGVTTLEAVKKYQQQHGLLFGQLTIQTLEHLGVFSPSINKSESMLTFNITKPSTEEGEPVTVSKVEGNIESQSLALQTNTQPKEKVNKEPLASSKQSDTKINSQADSKVDTSVAVNKEVKPVQKNLTNVNPPKSSGLVQVIENIVPKDRKQHLYQVVSGAKYYRCAANSLVPQKNHSGTWAYSSENQELSATLCKRSRDVATMTDLQYELYEKGYLRAPGLNKDQLLSGIWEKNTLAAVKKYQRENGLLYGQLTIQTLEDLGIFKADKNRIKWVDPTATEPRINPSEGQKQQTDSRNKVTEPVQKKSAVKQIEPVQQEVKVSGLVIDKRKDDTIDYSLFQPTSDKPKFYAKLDGQPLWRCRAQAFIAQKGDDGLISYGENKEYKATLCKMSRSQPIIKQLQLALKEQGYLKPNPPLDLVVIDGIWGINTLGALKDYQRANGLAYGQLTIESLERLGVFKNSK
ncbi:peptidoglycan-binding domain-containing protein [Thiomicrorhabdus sp.]|uniref:peptidoglycan-binding domain-containing protein n=1 Tax=Thiomicrorhabdus sp. TaxID=2039724 RepID=UPI002AA639A3|nr:peptidoglycan-binding domain-containing protein [Thiomicrorhabdus sp.]